MNSLALMMSWILSLFGLGATAEPLDPNTWGTALPGDWVETEFGAATRDGKLVVGGATVRITKGKRHARTPWSMSFIAPRAGHMLASNVRGGCGFYESGLAYCRGYGIPADGEHMLTTIAIENVGDGSDGDHIHVVVDGLVELYLSRERGE